MGFATDAIHAGQRPDPSTGAVVVPIYQTSTYVQEQIGKHKGYEYARTQNPTREALEKNIATLERGSRGIAFASGMAAIHAVLLLLQKGDHVLVSQNVYGGTFRLFDRILRNFGLEFSFVNTSSVEAVYRGLQSHTRMIFLETPTNPLMILSDIQSMSQLCRPRSIKLVVDNTFMTPYLQRPLELGADIVVHSTTKFLNGHSDSVGGVVVARDEGDGAKIAFIQNAGGAILSPFDSWLVLRGTKTLALRMRQHEENAREIARLLKEHPKVRKVYYPGLPEHPQHDLAKKQMSGFGGVISFDVGSLEKANAVASGVKLCSLGESLGGVETLLSHPATMTHAIVPRGEREKLGITEGLLRISVGVEDVEDLIEDLDQALAHA
ncbi:MAG: PLP-dependent transferase [Acidobacteria bacterium]|nr:PLP-dependent transferase [Acidobacteriota bacterium]